VLIAVVRDAALQGQATKARKRDGKLVSKLLGGGLDSNGLPRRVPKLTVQQAARNEKTRVKSRNTERKAQVDFEPELRTHWESQGKPDGNLKAHLTQLYWANMKTTALAAAQVADVAQAAEAMAVAEVQVAACRETQATPQAPKLTCNLLPIVLSTLHILVFVTVCDVMSVGCQVDLDSKFSFEFFGNQY
jgi:hypothetical protein